MRLLYSLGLMFALAVVGWSVQADVSIEDMRGRTLSLPNPAERVISLAPFLTELSYAAGAGEHLVGVVSYSDYPPGARQLPQVGNYKKIDFEALLALQPDIVLAWGSGNPSSQLARLADLGVPVFIAEPRQLDDIALLLERIGALAGTQDLADAAAADFRRRHAALRDRYSDKAPVSVFYQVWHRPVMTINGEHTISAVIRLCGGRNVFADLPQLAAQIGLEAVLAADPDAIVASGMDEARPDWLDLWNKWPQLSAVRNGNLFFIPPDIIQRHSPRILDGAQRLCRQLEQVRSTE